MVSSLVLAFLRGAFAVFTCSPAVQVPLVRVESYPKMVVFVNGMHIMKDRFPVALGSVIPQQQRQAAVAALPGLPADVPSPGRHS